MRPLPQGLHEQQGGRGRHAGLSSLCGGLAVVALKSEMRTPPLLGRLSRRLLLQSTAVSSCYGYCDCILVDLGLVWRVFSNQCPCCSNQCPCCSNQCPCCSNQCPCCSNQCPCCSNQCPCCSNQCPCCSNQCPCCSNQCPCCSNQCPCCSNQCPCCSNQCPCCYQNTVMSGVC